MTSTLRTLALRRHLQRAFILLGTTALIPLASADTVWLQNGDRISGTIKSLDSARLVIDTTYGGTLSLDWNAVRTLESTDPVLLPGAVGEPDRRVQLKAGEDKQVILVDGVSPQATPLADVSQFMKPRDRSRTPDLKWTGNLSVGIESKSASTETEDYAIAFNGSATHGDWRHNIGATYDRETENDATNTNNYGARYSLDRFLSDKFFWQGRAFAKRDTVEDLNRQYALGTGPGYQFWDDELGAFSLVGLAGRVHYRYSDGATEEFFAAGVGWNYTRKLYGQRAEVFLRGEASRPLDGSADFSLDAEVGLRYQLTDWAALTVAYGRDQVSGGRRSLNERRFTTGVGLTW